MNYLSEYTRLTLFIQKFLPSGIQDVRNKVLVFNSDTERVRFIDKNDKTIPGDYIIYSNESINSILNSKELCR